MRIRFYVVVACLSIAVVAGVSLAQSLKKPHTEARDTGVTKTYIPREVMERFSRQIARGKVFEDQARKSLAAGEYARALDSCEKAREFYKETAEEYGLNRLVGDIYFAQKQYATAKSFYLQGTRHTNNPILPINLALCDLRLGDYNQAKSGFSVIKLHERLARIHKQYQVEAANLPTVHDKASLEGSLLMTKGLTYYFREDFQKALAEFTVASALLPKNATTVYYTGMTLTHLNRRTEAAPYFATAARTGNGRLARDAHSRWIALEGNTSAIAE